MSDQDQTPGQQENTTPQFGSGGKEEPKPFTEDEVQNILKRNQHAQEHIKTLESETAQMREQLRVLQQEVERSKNMDDFLNEYQQQQQNTNEPGQTTQQLDKDQLLAQVKEEVFNELTAAQRAELEEQNWSQTTKLLQDKYGERYAYYVDERARELDMTNEEMEALARTKPKLFMELLGGAKQNTPPPTQSSRMSNPGGNDGDIEVMFARVQRLRRDLSTEEGREAARMWSDPSFQARYRQHILEKARREGKF